MVFGAQTLLPVGIGRGNRSVHSQEWLCYDKLTHHPVAKFLDKKAAPRLLFDHFSTRVRQLKKGGTMGKINWGRVILGGLVAGLVINIFEYVLNTYVIAKDATAAMKALGVQLAPHAIPMFIAAGFVVGIVTIWLYAAARPRYGASAKTAVITAFAVWLLAYAIPDFEIGLQNLFPTRLLCIGAAVGLVEIIVASVVGAALYKEA